jgi:predicted DNA-binding protein with PD1-like motif
MYFGEASGKYLLKIEKGELVVETIASFCWEQGIKNALISGIGAVEWVKCGYYALKEKQYYFTEYDELVEVVSLTGNVMQKDEQPFVHVHGVFTDTKNMAFGGHILEMRVGVVLEVVLEPLDSTFSRLPDECIGLSLVDLPNKD